MSEEVFSVGSLDNRMYRGEFTGVDVDQSGFYTETVYMEELCYCVGAVSVHEEGLYAAHISPGNIGLSPEEQMNEFKEGFETYIVSGVNSVEYDPETLDTVLESIEEDTEIFQDSEFAVDADGELFGGVAERPRRSPLL